MKNILNLFLTFIVTFGAIAQSGEKYTILVEEGVFVDKVYSNCINEFRFSIFEKGGAFIDMEGVTLKSEENVEVKEVSSGKMTHRIKSDSKVAGFTLNAYKEDVLLCSKRFRVIKAPSPTLNVFMGGREINGSRPVDFDASIQVKVVPNKNFKTLMPREAIYNVEQVEVYLIRDNIVVEKQQFMSDKMELTPWIDKVKPLDLLQVKVKRVTRNTSLDSGNRESVRLECVEVFNLMLK